ncbi:hypothetical protein [Streptomyces sp. ISL-98]|uniref:hypothetical protein n=1 Tax=Streptomyces sp. ISL-98 TaxID=2819192 RepID=UPI0035AEF19A
MVWNADPPGNTLGPGTVSWAWAGSAPAQDAANTGIKSWPDMREYTMSYHTGYAALGNGQAAALFSSYDQQSVDTHFTWMQQYGIDTAALQRFKPTGGESPARDAMAAKVRSAAESQGVKFYIMYDHQLDGHAQQNGKPVVTSPRLGDAQPSAGAVRQRGPARSPRDPGTGGGHGRLVMTLSRGAPSCEGARSRRSRRRRRGCRRRA